MPNKKNIGLALSGGGSRAIAFHLGCLRALNKLNLLDRIQVVSSVSGGSVIAALYAYSDGPFEEFEEQVISILQDGLDKDILKEYIKPKNLFSSLGTFLIAGLASLALDFLSFLFKIIQVCGFFRLTENKLSKISLNRWHSRTNVFENVLNQKLFFNKTINQISKPDLDVVINATELRTGTSFQFSNRNTGCWRFGKIENADITVAKGVAASASYPALLPALFETFQFKKNENKQTETVILTDGGVYENLGVNCLEPTNNPDYNTNAFKVDYIFCCDAGPGQFSGETKPFWWWSRMSQAFEITFRQVQIATYGKLHRFKENGDLSGFILSYLGQQDGVLPMVIENLVTRDEVKKYPTDFSIMPESMIEKISLRGEQLTNALVKYYCSELLD